MLVWGRGFAPSAARQIRPYACCFPAAASDRKRGAAPERVRKYRQTHPVYRALWKSVKRMSQSVMAPRWVRGPPLPRAEKRGENCRVFKGRCRTFPVALGPRSSRRETASGIAGWQFLWPRIFPAGRFRASHLTGVAMNSSNRRKNVLPKWSVLLVLLAVTAVASAQKDKKSAPAPHASAPSKPAAHAAPAQHAGGSAKPGGAGGSAAKAGGAGGAANRGPGGASTNRGGAAGANKTGTAGATNRPGGANANRGGTAGANKTGAAGATSRGPAGAGAGKGSPANAGRGGP